MESSIGCPVRPWFSSLKKFSKYRLSNYAPILLDQLINYLRSTLNLNIILKKQHTFICPSVEIIKKTYQ